MAESANTVSVPAGVVAEAAPPAKTPRTTGRPAALSVRRNIVWYALPRLLSRATAFALLPIYTRVLTPAEMGAAMVALALGGFGSLVVAPGIETVYIRWASRQDGECRERGMGTVTLLHLGLLALGAAVLWTFRGLIGSIVLKGIPLWPFYHLVTATLLLSSLEIPLTAVWRAEHRADKVARLSLAHTVISTGVIVFCLLGWKLGAVSLLLGDLADALVFLPVYAWNIAARLREGWRHDVFRGLVPIALAGFPVGLAGYALSGLDRILLNHVAGAAQVGLYAVGFQIGVVVMAIAIVFSQEWKPLIFALAATPSRQPGALQGLWTRTICAFVALGSVVVLFSADIVNGWLGASYLASAVIIPPVVLMCLFRISRDFMVHVGLALGKARAVSAESLASVAVFTAAALLLIPRLGAQGAAWAGVITYAASSAFLFTRSWNALRVEPRLTAWAAAGLGATLCAAVRGGTPLTQGLGAAVGVLAAAEAFAYWKFLGTLRPVEARA